MISINQVYSLFTILLLSFCSFAQKENSGNLFEVSVNGTKWLFDSSLNNFSGQINDLSFIRLEEINNNYRVPTFDELELMFTQKVALPAYTEKEECEKMCYCRSEKMSYYFPDDVDCPYHRCIKCSSWTV